MFGDHKETQSQRLPPSCLFAAHLNLRSNIIIGDLPTTLAALTNLGTLSERPQLSCIVLLISNMVFLGVLTKEYLDLSSNIISSAVPFARLGNLTRLCK
jgi:hypothetical protein